MGAGASGVPGGALIGSFVIRSGWCDTDPTATRAARLFARAGIGYTVEVDRDERRRLAEAVRAACVQAALDAFEQGGYAGLCLEGRWDLALSAMKALPVGSLLEGERLEGERLEGEREPNDHDE